MDDPVHTLAIMTHLDEPKPPPPGRAYPESPVRVRVGPTCLPEDGCDHEIEIMIGVGIIVTFGESIDKDTGVRRFDFDLRVGTIVVGNGEEKIPFAFVGVDTIGILARLLRAPFPIIAGEMIPNHRMDLHLAQKPSSRFHNPECQNGKGNGNGAIDAVLNVGENGDQHADEKDDHFQGRDPPKLINGVRRGDEVSDRMDDDCGQGRVGNVKKHGR